MAYKEVKNLEGEEFKRYTGVRKETFHKMVEILTKKEKRKKKSGRPAKVGKEDKILITLEYLREYRTYFHIGVSWGISESQVCRIVREVEAELIKSKEFHLPGKKKLLEPNTEIEIVVVDVGESAIERPKKNKKHITVVKRSSTQ